MNISSESDSLMMSYLSILDELNLTHLLTELDNSTDLQSILRENFIWPPDMRFTTANVICITVYAMQLVVGLAVNSYSLVYLLRERLALHNKNRMILLLIHLTFADLFVRKLLIPHYLCYKIDP